MAGTECAAQGLQVSRYTVGTLKGLGVEGVSWACRYSTG